MSEHIDKQEFEIVRELIKNPRISDNQIAKNTSLPLKSINRKRKRLEADGLLQYFTYLDTGRDGTGDFSTRQMYIITFRYGVTRKHFLDALKEFQLEKLLVKHIFESYLGEKDGRLVLILVMESRQDSDIIEIFNTEIRSILVQRLGGDPIHDVTAIRLDNILLMLHNYVPKRNYKKGITTKSIRPQDIFVADNIRTRE